MQNLNKIHLNTDTLGNIILEIRKCWILIDFFIAWDTLKTTVLS